MLLYFNLSAKNLPSIRGSFLKSGTTLCVSKNKGVCGGSGGSNQDLNPRTQEVTSPLRHSDSSTQLSGIRFPIESTLRHIHSTFLNLITARMVIISDQG
jgi:hypothetical protein